MQLNKDPQENRLRSLIDKIESEIRTQGELEQSISVLRNENTTLKLTIDEQKALIKKLRQELKISSEELPENIKILKDIIVSQRREIIRKDEENEILRELLDKFTNAFENSIIDKELTKKESKSSLTDVKGIGPKIDAKLKKAGIDTIQDLLNCDSKTIASRIKGIGVVSLNKWKKSAKLILDK